MPRTCALLLSLALTAPLAQPTPAQSPTPTPPDLRTTVQDILTEPAVARAHWGISVTGLDGTPLLSLNDAQYFQPASNAKLFTTAAVMALLPVDGHLTTTVAAVGGSLVDGTLTGNLLLTGAADANLSGRPVPYQAPHTGKPDPPRNELRYMDQLADQVRAKGIRVITGDIIADDPLPYQPYPPDWPLDDIVWYYGAPVSGLMIADNSITVSIRPGTPLPPSPGAGNPPLYSRPIIQFDPDLPYYSVDAQDLQTLPAAPGNSASRVDFARLPGSTLLRISGTVVAGTTPYTQAISIDDPAEYAALALKRSLEQRGIVVRGKARASHHAPPAQADFAPQPTDAPPAPPPAPQHRAEHLFQATLPQIPGATDCDTPRNLPGGGILCLAATHTGPTLYDDVVITNKISQNQHAELMLRLLSRSLNTNNATTANNDTNESNANNDSNENNESNENTGTTAGGSRIVRRFLTGQANIDPQDFYLNDGSGMSTHDLVTPRAITRLLTWAATQPWGAKWKASLPIGGVDGSLRNRFPAPPLAGHVFAKTGTLGEARALSGYLDCSSGQTVAFSILVSLHTPLNTEDQRAMDRIVAAIAAAE